MGKAVQNMMKTVMFSRAAGKVYPSSRDHVGRAHGSLQRTPSTQLRRQREDSEPTIDTGRETALDAATILEERCPSLEALVAGTRVDTSMEQGLRRPLTFRVLDLCME